MLVPGCANPGATVTFSGTRHAALVGAAAIAVIDGEHAPTGMRVIGVAGARCETINGTSGLLAGPCTEAAMIDRMRHTAADNGGTALFDARCRSDVLERDVETLDGGTVAVTLREALSCQGTVLRGSKRQATVRAPEGSPRLDEGTKNRVRITVSGTAVDVAFDRRLGATPGARREEAAVLVVTSPGDRQKLGRLSGECPLGCARSVVHRALRRRAAELGADALLTPTCELDVERWRCNTTLLGPAPVEPDDSLLDAGATDAAETDGG
jgi:hypothetical protein